MKKIYVIIILLIALLVGAILFFGMGREAEAPASEFENIVVE